jgi:phage-related protein
MAKEEEELKTLFFSDVEKFIKEQSEIDRAKVAVAFVFMENGNFEQLHIKTLKGHIKEFIVRSCRITFFRQDNIIYFVGAFRKKSAKTPRKEIEEAEKVYKIVKNEKSTNK